VAGIGGNAASSSRIRGSNASATDPCGARAYFGGLSLASAACTVFREIPITRAISAIGMPSARRSRRISAQSSTLSTCSLPGSAGATISGELVKIRFLPRPVFSFRRHPSPATVRLCDPAAKARADA
jgi:hypothetical protein